MTDVEFIEEQQYAPRTTYQKTVGRITDWLIKNRLAKDEEQANLVMLLVSCAAVIIAIGAPLVLGGDHGSVSPQERAKIEQSTVPQPRTR